MSLPRSDTNPDDHARVDEALKKLKNASKRIQAAGTVFAEESRLLERLYYKSKNQHRSALFFQRVEQVRRIAKRITTQNMPLLVDGLRNTFYQEVPKSTKLSRSAWNQLPSPKQVADALLHVRQTCQLLDAARDIYAKAYRILMNFIQGATFMPLVVVLVGLVSRADALCVELRHAFIKVSDAAHTIYGILEPNASPAILGRLKPPSPPQNFDTVSEPLPLLPSAAMVPEMGEDIGAAIVRRSSPVLLALSSVTLAPEIVTDDVDEDVCIVLPPIQPLMEMEEIYKGIRNESQERKATNSKKSVVGPVKEMQKIKKKRKKTRDEIDEIFG